MYNFDLQRLKMSKNLPNPKKEKYSFYEFIKGRSKSVEKNYLGFLRF